MEQFCFILADISRYSKRALTLQEAIELLDELPSDDDDDGSDIDGNISVNDIVILPPKVDVLTDEEAENEGEIGDL